MLLNCDKSNLLAYILSFFRCIWRIEILEASCSEQRYTNLTLLSSFPVDAFVLFPVGLSCYFAYSLSCFFQLYLCSATDNLLKLLLTFMPYIIQYLWAFIYIQAYIPSIKLLFLRFFTYLYPQCCRPQQHSLATPIYYNKNF